MCNFAKRPSWLPKADTSFIDEDNLKPTNRPASHPSNQPTDQPTDQTDRQTNRTKQA